MLGAEQTPFSPIELVSQFKNSISGIIARFGTAVMHGILAWTVTAPILVGLAYLCLKPFFTTVNRKRELTQAAKAQ
ncbi:MAG: hypothetical protein CMO80_20220 [Verrucomicrobiales bacterium]|nr:hypothetical protein [Verrucomicrobiales bacterium]